MPRRSISRDFSAVQQKVFPVVFQMIGVSVT
jgi:hypothetical protein